MKAGKQMQEHKQGTEQKCKQANYNHSNEINIKVTNEMLECLQLRVQERDRPNCNNLKIKKQQSKFKKSGK